MTSREMFSLIQQLNLVFDLVRLVDVTLTIQLGIDEAGNIFREPYQCYAVWNRKRRCENCIAAKAFARKNKLNKFEFVNNEIYHVTAMYVEVEDEPCVLEMVSHITDETLFGACGRDELAKSIITYNNKLYIDPLTGAYNRRYYEEQLSGLLQMGAVAMVDVDDFKSINDSYGHQAGDKALRTVVDVIHACVRRTDMVVRYGGDEFVLVFQDVPRQAFAERLERICAAVCQIRLPDYPEIALSVSIGGAYGPGRTGEMVSEADRLLYLAKSRKNSVEIG